MTDVWHPQATLSDDGGIPDLFTLLEPPAWHNQAACAGSDPDLFFPERGAHTKEAKEVCAGCPVSQDCLDWALTHHEKHGIWGGLSERQRRTMRPRRGPTSRTREQQARHDLAITLARRLGVKAAAQQAGVTPSILHRWLKAQEGAA